MTTIFKLPKLNRIHFSFYYVNLLVLFDFPTKMLIFVLEKLFECYATYCSMMKEIILLIVTYYHNEYINYAHYQYLGLFTTSKCNKRKNRFE